VKVTAYGRQTVPDRGVVRSCDPLQNFWGSNHIIRTAEPKVVKFCTRVGYINSNNRMTYHQQKGRGYGHVTVLKFAVCRDAARRAGLSATAELLVTMAAVGCLGVLKVGNFNCPYFLMASVRQSNGCQDMAVIRFFKMAAVRHRGFLKV